MTFRILDLSTPGVTKLTNNSNSQEAMNFVARISEFSMQVLEVGGETEPPQEVVRFAPVNPRIIGSLIIREMNSTNPSSFDINSIYSEVGRLNRFRQDSQKYTLDQISDFFSLEDSLGSILLKKEKTFRPAHILADFNYTPLNKDLDLIDSESEVIAEDAKQDSSTSKVWLRNYASGVFKNWNARWAIIENILEENGKIQNFIVLNDDDANDNISGAMQTSLPKVPANDTNLTNFKQELDSVFIPKIAQEVGSIILQTALELKLADTYIKSCYGLNPITDYKKGESSESIIARETDTYFALGNGRPFFSEASNGRPFFDNVEQIHTLGGNSPGFGSDLGRLGRYNRTEISLISRSSPNDANRTKLTNPMKVGLYPSDLESARAQVQFLRDINLYLDHLQFRVRPDPNDTTQTSRLVYIPGPRHDIFDFAESGSSSRFIQGTKNGDSSYLRAFLIRKVFAKAAFLNNRDIFLHTNHTIEDTDSGEKQIFPDRADVDLRNFKLNNTDDISNFFYNPISVGDKIVVLTDSLTKDYYSETGIYFSTIVDELEIKKTLLRKAILENQDDQSIRRKFLPTPDKSELASYVFEKLFPFKTSEGDSVQIERHEHSPINSTDLDVCTANILLDHRNVVTHLTRGRMIKHIWNSAIASAVYCHGNKTSETSNFKQNSLNYSIKFFNIDSRIASRVQGINVDPNEYYSAAMGFQNPNNMNITELEEVSTYSSNLASARDDFFDLHLPGINNGRMVDRHIFGDEIVGDAVHGFTGDGKLKKNFEVAINNALCHVVSSKSTKAHLIFFFVIMQLSTRLNAFEGEEINEENSPFFMIDRGPGYAPMPQIAFQIAMRYMKMMGVGPDFGGIIWNPLAEQVDTNDPIFGIILNVFQEVRDSFSELEINDGPTPSFSISAQTYVDTIRQLKDYLINSPTSPFSKQSVFQNIYDEHNKVADLPNSLNYHARKYRKYLHLMGGLAGGIRRDSFSISESQLDKFGEFLDLNSQPNSYKNVALDFLSRGNYHRQFHGETENERRQALGRSRQNIITDMTEFRGAISTQSNLSEVRGRYKTGVRGIGAGGSRSRSTFANLDSEYLRSDEFKDKLLNPLKEAAFKTGKTNPFVMVAENICAQLFYGFDAFGGQTGGPGPESHQELGYYTNFNRNNKGILKYLDMLQLQAEGTTLFMDDKEIFTIVWEYCKIGADLIENLPNFDFNFQFSHSDPDSETNSYRSFDGVQSKSFASTLQQLTRTPNLNTPDGVETLLEKIHSAEITLANALGPYTSKISYDRNGETIEFDGITAGNQRNFDNLVEASSGQNLIAKLYNYMELANAYFSISESLTSIEPEFKLEITSTDDLQIYQHELSNAEHPMDYFRHALKIGCLPHLSIISENNVFNFKKLLQLGGENSQLRTTATRALELHLKQYGAFKNIKNYVSAGLANQPRSGINAIPYGYKGYPHHYKYENYLNGMAGQHSIYSFIPDEASEGGTNDVNANLLARGTGVLVTPPTICGFLPVIKRNDGFETDFDGKHTVNNSALQTRSTAIAGLFNNTSLLEGLSERERIANFGYANTSAVISSLNTAGENLDINIGNSDTSSVFTQYDHSPSKQQDIQRETTLAFTREDHFSVGPLWVYRELVNNISDISHLINKKARDNSVTSISPREASRARSEHFSVRGVVSPTIATRNSLVFTTHVSKVTYNFVEGISYLNMGTDYGNPTGHSYYQPHKTLKNRQDWRDRNDSVKTAPAYFSTGAFSGVVFQRGDAERGPKSLLGMSSTDRIIEMAKLVAIMLSDEPSPNGIPEEFHGYSDVYIYCYNNWPASAGGPSGFRKYMNRFIYSFYQFVKEEQALGGAVIQTYLPHFKLFDKTISGVFKHLRPGNATQFGEFPEHYSKDDCLYRMSHRMARNPNQPPITSKRVFSSDLADSGAVSAPIVAGSTRTQGQGMHTAPFRNHSSNAKHLFPLVTIGDLIERCDQLFSTDTFFGNSRLYRLGGYKSIVDHSNHLMLKSSFDQSPSEAVPFRENSNNTDIVKFPADAASYKANRQRSVIPFARRTRWSDVYVPICMRASTSPWLGFTSPVPGQTPHGHRTGANAAVFGTTNYGCNASSTWALHTGYEGSIGDSYDEAGFTQYNFKMQQIWLGEGSPLVTGLSAFSPGEAFKGSVEVPNYIPYTMGRSIFCSLGETRTRELYFEDPHSSITNYECEIQDANLNNNMNGTINSYGAAEYGFAVETVSNGTTSTRFKNTWKSINYSAQSEHTHDWTFETQNNALFYNNLLTPFDSNLVSSGRRQASHPRRGGSTIYHPPRNYRKVPLYGSSHGRDSRSCKIRVFVYDQSGFVNETVTKTYGYYYTDLVYNSQNFKASTSLYPNEHSWNGVGYGNSGYKHGLNQLSNTALGIEPSFDGLKRDDRYQTTSPIIDIFPFKPFVIDYGPTMNDFSPSASWIPTANPNIDGVKPPEQVTSARPRLSRYSPYQRIADYSRDWMLRDPSVGNEGNKVHYVDLSTETNPKLGFLKIHYDDNNCKIIVQWYPDADFLRLSTQYRRPNTIHSFEPNVNGIRINPLEFYWYLPGFDYYDLNDGSDNDRILSAFTRFRMCFKTWGQDYRVVFNDNFEETNSSIAEYELVNRSYIQKDARQAYQKRVYFGVRNNVPEVFSLNPINSTDYDSDPGVLNIDTNLFGQNQGESLESLDINIPFTKSASSGSFEYDFGEADDFLFEKVLDLETVTENKVSFPVGVSNLRINLGTTYYDFWKNFKYFPNISENRTDMSNILSPFQTNAGANNQNSRNRIVGVYKPHEVLGITEANFHNNILASRKRVREDLTAQAIEFCETLDSTLKQYLENTQWFHRVESLYNAEETNLLTQLGVWPEYSLRLQEHNKYILSFNFIKNAANYFVYLTPYSLSYPEIYVYAQNKYESVRIPGSAVVDFHWEKIHEVSFIRNNEINNNLSDRGLNTLDSFYNLESHYMNFLVCLHKTSKLHFEAYYRAMEKYVSIKNLIENVSSPENNHSTLESELLKRKILKIISNIGFFAKSPDVVSNLENIYSAITMHSLTEDEAEDFIKDISGSNIRGVAARPGKFSLTTLEVLDEGNEDELNSNLNYLRAPFKLSPYSVSDSSLNNLSFDSHLSTWKDMEGIYHDKGIISKRDTRVCVVGIESSGLDHILDNDRLSLETVVQSRSNRERKNLIDTSGFFVEVVIKDLTRPYLNFERIEGNLYFSRSESFYLHPNNRAGGENSNSFEDNFKHWQTSPVSVVLGSSGKQHQFQAAKSRLELLRTGDHTNYLKTFTYNTITEDHEDFHLDPDDRNRSREELDSNESIDLYLKLYMSRVLGLDYFPFMIPIGQQSPVIAPGTSEGNLKGFEESFYQEKVNPYLSHIIDHIGTKTGDDETIFETIKYFIDRKDLRSLFDRDQITHFDSIGRKVLTPNLNESFSIFTNNFLVENDVETESEGSQVRYVRPFEFKTPITQDSLKTAETIVNVNTYDPDGYRKISSGFAFDKIIAFPYKLSHFKVSRKLDTNYIEEFRSDFPVNANPSLDGVVDQLDTDQLEIVGRSLNYADEGQVDRLKQFLLKDDGNHPFTLQVRILPKLN